MKKLFIFSLSLVLLLSAIPVMAAAAEKITLLIDNKPVTFPDIDQPYEKQNEVMVPLRLTAQALGLKVTYEQAENTAHLVAPSMDIALQIGSAEASINGTERIAFGTASESMSNHTFVPLSFFSKLLGFITAYHSESSEAVISSPGTIASTITGLLITGSYQQLSDEYLDESVKKSISVAALQAGWQQITSIAGDYMDIKSIQLIARNPESMEFTALIGLTKANAMLKITLNNNGKVIGLLLNLVQQEVDLPTGLKEEEVIVGEGSAYPLKGTLTLPDGVTGPVPAIVLVQGSGPSDRDETTAGYKPFRDIAWGLAQQGIAVLRYDKRTYVYGKSFTQEMLASFTVKEETVDDAIAAADLLKRDSRIDASQVYVAGHSLGGMLAPRMDADGGDFAGLIILAGTTRSLWEISHDQNEAFINAMDANNPAKKTNEDWLAAELAKAQNIRNLSDEEAMAETVFGMSAYYLKEMDSHSAAELTRKLTKPILVMQGADDFQVYADIDYPLWQKELASNPDATFKLYPDLNHFFINYEGEGEGTTAEYNHPGYVEPQVITDMANWILELTRNKL